MFTFKWRKTYEKDKVYRTTDYFNSSPAAPHFSFVRPHTGTQASRPYEIINKFGYKIKLYLLCEVKFTFFTFFKYLLYAKIR